MIPRSRRSLPRSAPRPWRGLVSAFARSLALAALAAECHVGDLLTTNPGGHNPALAAVARLSVTSQPATTAAGSPITARVEALDSLGRIVPGFAGSVTASLQAGSAASGSTPPLLGDSVVAADSGVATFSDLRIDRAAADYEIRFSVGAVSALSAPFAVTPAAPRGLAVAVAAPTSATAGAPLVPQPALQVTDSFGNAAPAAGVTVAASIASGPAGATLAGAGATTDATGRAAFTALAVSGGAGSYTLQFAAGGLRPATSGPVALRAPTGHQLGITTPPSSSASSGVPLAQQPVVQVLDSSGAPAAQAGVAVSAAILTGGGALGGTSTVSTDANGRAAFTNLAISGTVGDRTLSFSAPGLGSVASGTIALAAGPASQIALRAGDGQSAPAGTAVAVAPSVIVHDAAGNPVTGTAVTFAVAAGGGSVTPTTPITTDATGIASVTSWTLGPSAGTNTLTASASGLTGSPVTFSATGTPGSVSASQSTVSASPTSITAGSGTSTITVTAKDANGNPVSGATVVLSATGTGNTLTQPSTVTNASGVATGSLGSTTTGTKTVSATVNSVAITQTATVTVTTGTVSASQSAVTASPTSITAGSGTSTITVTAKDANGNPISGATVVLAATGSGNTLTQPSAVTNASGVATGTLSSTVAESKTVSATGNGVAISQTATVTVTAAAASPSQSVVTLSASSIVVLGTVTATLTAKDAYGNPVIGATVVFTLSGGLNLGAFGPTTDHGNGTYTATFTGASAGTTTVGATINGVAVTSPLPTLTITP